MGTIIYDDIHACEERVLYSESEIEEAIKSVIVDREEALVSEAEVQSALKSISVSDEQEIFAGHKLEHVSKSVVSEVGVKSAVESTDVYGSEDLVSVPSEINRESVVTLSDKDAKDHKYRSAGQEEDNLVNKEENAPFDKEPTSRSTSSELLTGRERVEMEKKNIEKPKEPMRKKRRISD